MKLDLKAVLAGILSLLAGLFFWERGKRKSAEALLENQATKEKLTEIDGKINVNEAKLEVEEDRRKALQEDMKKEQDKDVSTKDVEDFFRNRN